MKILGVVPARYGSSRFPGKPLCDLMGKPMIQHVYERALGARLVERILVATDSERIYKTVRDFGGEAIMTRENCRSGTDRVAEVAEKYPYDIFVNIQGDEPLMESGLIDETIEPMLKDGEIQIATPAKAISSETEYLDPNVVKVVCNRDDFALYFSRSPIPYSSNGKVKKAYKHIGLYVYRREALLKLSRMDMTELEMVESLEQLRAIENGYKIKVIISSYDSVGVDTPEDLERVKRLMEKRR